MTEQEKLKQFMLDNFDYDGLKQAGFYSKAIKRKDFEAQAARVCQWFGYKTVYEYNPPEITEIEGANVAVASGSGSINPKGEYEAGYSALLCTVQSSFTCPACTCEQEPKIKGMYGKQKCKGCKRKLSVSFDIAGNISVCE